MSLSSPVSCLRGGGGACDRARSSQSALIFFVGQFFLGCAVVVETSVGDLQRVGDKLAGQWQGVELIIEPTRRQGVGTRSVSSWNQFSMMIRPLK